MCSKSLRRLLAFMILVIVLAACQSGNNQIGTSQPLGDKVEKCSDPYLPVITTETSPKPSAQIIYFISGVHLYALNAGNGALRWCVSASNANSRLALQADIDSILMGPPPPPDGLSGMTVSNGTLYACSEDNYTYAFGASSGSLLWQYNTGFANTSAPTVVKDIVYVGSGTVYALNAQDGSLRWKYPTQDVVTSSPIVVNDIIYFGSYDGGVYALDAATGSKHWVYQAGGRVYIAPVVSDDSIYFGAGNDGPSLYAINAQEGKLIWHKTLLVSSSLAIANGILYVGANNYLYALNAQDGTVRWRYPIDTSTPINPLVVNDVIYVASGNGMYALNASDGTLRWHDPLNTMRAGVTTVPVMIKDELYVGTIDLGVSESKAMIHALNANNGTEDWYASVSWNISTISVAA